MKDSVIWEISLYYCVFFLFHFLCSLSKTPIMHILFHLSSFSAYYFLTLSFNFPVRCFCYRFNFQEFLYYHCLVFCSILLFYGCSISYLSKGIIGFFFKFYFSFMQCLCFFQVPFCLFVLVWPSCSRLCSKYLLILSQMVNFKSKGLKNQALCGYLLGCLWDVHAISPPFLRGFPYVSILNSYLGPFD